MTDSKKVTIKEGAEDAQTPFAPEWARPSELSAFRLKSSKFCAPVEVAPPTGATHLIKHASDQISQQAAKRVDHDGPEKVLAAILAAWMVRLLNF